MNPASLIDVSTLAIVVGGTLLATFLRCGLADCRATLRQLGRTLISGRPFDADAVRAHMARVLQDIHRDGLLRAQPDSVGDAEFDAALDALVAQRSVAGAREALHQQRESRLAPVRAANNTLVQAAELAPVFGLAGTLISLGRLPTSGVDRAAYMPAIAMAVHATLYGLIAAHLVLGPLARLVERHAGREDNQRRALAEWLESEVVQAIPRRDALRHVVAAPHAELEGEEA
ncbi:MAG: MotA/TolQ/ExbB proton channel family protein [Sphingomonadales bacterium]|nr:MotA/TolQ/ExbB proton channel family protein [Sphingomonadales bacterium]MDE2169725.1 MotA/TolQ/ExbB proton channel family protein [Sphingomonadales bacterium]